MSSVPLLCINRVGTDWSSNQIGRPITVKCVQFISNLSVDQSKGGCGSSAVERTTPIEEVRYPLWPPAPYWLGRCQYNVTG